MTTEEKKRPDLADYKDEIHHPNGHIEDRWKHNKYIEDLEKYVDYLEQLALHNEEPSFEERLREELIKYEWRKIHGFESIIDKESVFYRIHGGHVDEYLERSKG